MNHDLPLLKQPVRPIVHLTDFSIQFTPIQMICEPATHANLSYHRSHASHAGLVQGQSVELVVQVCA